MHANPGDLPWLNSIRKLFQAKPPESRRWIVLDVETSGLDPYSDRLLAIAAVAVEVSSNFENVSIVIGDSYEAVLKQDIPTNKENVLIHHIGRQAQTEGRPPEEVLEGFRQWAGDCPLLAFHAPFDEAMIHRAFKAFGLKPLLNEWLDIEPLAKITGVNPSIRALDEWLNHFGIECAIRHQAAADTFATAELLMRLWPQLKKEANSWASLRKLSRQASWIPGS
ncbi:3'-5' exonuclease [Polynucleobacter antarcticus]|uniref:DNA polymerase III subunit epsilon n=1 Tax=Polynucleobacter antarcticus TaxID=1743162 RepID=A0A6M9PWI7_9BURK|nr:3'-5' exonuclease [Polynucleobacter antarcticus]QKM63317.1 DNA polymerase III subunit epsilon [Polynucleobacter antarcticus]